MYKIFENFGLYVVHTICLCFTFDEIAIECSFEDWRVVARELFVNDELLDCVLRSDVECNEAYGCAICQLVYALEGAVGELHEKLGGEGFTTIRRADGLIVASAVSIGELDIWFTI